MKNLALIIFGIFLSLQGFSQRTADTIISNNPQKLKVKVLYFHITHRCNTCFSIEANVRKTLNDYFKSKIDSGIIDLYILDCELPENKEIANKYEAFGATLALTTYADKKELKTEDLTNWAFQKIHSSEVFISELKTKIETLLK
ncbi:MAG: nitrophenyl compound nitroreductase subunit ArsF family protein [Bacteroidales bacterium]|nr:nitrophenyl compound nitroreductase subunit ArsF family protein [Bacteroidales bacterium]